MTMWTKIKSWFVKAAQPEPEPVHKTIDLPNGRKAVVDQCGNFIEWLDSP